MSEDRFEALETKLSFQEHMLQTLDEVMVDQQKQISELHTLVKHLSKQINEVEGQLPDGPESPPPHY